MTENAKMWKNGKSVLRYRERCCVWMKITEINNCIEKMRECYKFDDNKTEIRIGDCSGCEVNRYVSVCTLDNNGTKIEMTRYADELAEK